MAVLRTFLSLSVALALRKRESRGIVDRGKLGGARWLVRAAKYTALRTR
jgi:hypothetical protein